MHETDVKSYWERRFQDGPTLGTVGWLGLGQAYNQWMYRVRAALFERRVRRALRRCRIAPERARVLDVGSGSGFYVERWQRLGVRDLSGCDLTDASVAGLQARYLGVAFSQADIGDASPPFEEQSFDAISCMDVLFHIVDDRRYAQAIRNCARLLRPGGVLIFSDNFLHGTSIRISHQASRTLGEIEEQLAGARLLVLERRPVFVLMNTPVDSRSRVLQRYWRVLNRVVRRNETAGFLAGSVLYPIELLCTSLLREGPSTEMAICRRPELP